MKAELSWSFAKHLEKKKKQITKSATGKDNLAKHPRRAESLQLVLWAVGYPGEPGVSKCPCGTSGSFAVCKKSAASDRGANAPPAMARVPAPEAAAREEVKDAHEHFLAPYIHILKIKSFIDSMNAYHV